jgi:hypothetical protein
MVEQLEHEHGSKKGPLFKKRRKNFFLRWAPGAVPATPMPQTNKVFLLLFVHKK